MAGFKFDYKPVDYGDFYGEGGGGGGGGGGRRDQNNRNFNNDGKRRDDMDWQRGGGGGNNRFQGGGGGNRNGGGVRRDDLLPNRRGGPSVSGMLGAPQSRDMWGMGKGGPQTLQGSGAGNLDAPMGRGNAASGFGGGGPSPLGVPADGAAPGGYGRGGRPQEGGRFGVGGMQGAPQTMQGQGGQQPGAPPPSLFGKNGQLDIAALQSLMGGNGRALSAGVPYDPVTGTGGSVLTPEQQQGKALQYANAMGLRQTPEEMMRAQQEQTRARAERGGTFMAEQYGTKNDGGGYNMNTQQVIEDMRAGKIPWQDKQTERYWTQGRGSKL